MKLDFSEQDKRVSSVHNFKDNAEVIGSLVAIEDGQYGKQFIITNEQNEQITVGSYTALEGKIRSSDIGKPIKIVFRGEQKSKKGGRTYMDFDVFIKE